MALTLGEALAITTSLTAHQHFTDKEHTAFAWLLLCNTELNLKMLFLRPFYKTALIVLVRLQNLINITQTRKNLVEQETAALPVPFIKVYSPDQCLQGISIDITVMSPGKATRRNELVDTYFQSKFIKPFTADQIAARFRQKPFPFLSETCIQEIRSHRTEHRVAKEFKTFITYEFTGTGQGRRTVRHRHAIEFYIPGNKPQYGV